MSPGQALPDSRQLQGLPSERPLMARTLAYLFAAGGVLALASLSLRDSLDGFAELAHLAPFIGAAALAAGSLLFVLVRRAAALQAWAYHAVLVSETVFISLAVHNNGGSGTFAIFYILVALYSAYFFRWPGAAFQLGVVATAYGAVLLAQPSGGVDAIAGWFPAVGVLAVSVFLIRMLKDRLDRMIARLADAARTDVLTGLPNRRAFEETFDTELERAKRTGRPLTLILGDVDRFKALNDRFGHSVGDETLQRIAAVLDRSRRKMDHVARIGGEEFALVVPESSEHAAYVLGERLRRAVREEFQGSDRQVTMSLGVASFPAHGGTTEALFQASDGALYAAKELGRDRCVIHNSEIAAALASAAARKEAQREGYLATILALAEALDVRDSGTAQHSQTVARYSELLARELELEAELVERVRLGGMLHDVGKIGVPDSVLNKPGPLDESEWREMRAHPLIAARILDSATVEDIRSWVLSHHERHDGAGYPQGLEGDEIPLEARILAVADAYEAMTSDRVYRPALTPDEARAELVSGAGSQFDPLVVQAMLRVLDRLGIAQLAA
jgi:two-component system cell cycle response regulator